MTSARSIALDVLDRVFFDDAYSHIALSSALDTAGLSERDRGLTTELVYGTLARKRTLDELLTQFVNRPLEDVDRPVLLSLRMAAYQLLFLDRIPAHAAVHEAVELSTEHCGRGAGGFTNGVLRSLLRNEGQWQIWEGTDPSSNPVLHLGLRHSLPDWIAAILIDHHGFDEAMRIAASFNDRPALYLRVLGDVPDSVSDCIEAVQGVPGAFRTDAMSPPVLEAVQDHQLVVQDLGSQLIGHFCGPLAGERLLDACAGLGGKALHLAELAGEDARVMAVDPQKSKLDQLTDVAQTTSLADRIDTFYGELDALPNDHDGFDVVLVDAPCTGLGTIRRHPEIRWRRSEEDVEALADLQETLLAQAAARVRPGGRLIYSVCTFTNREGPQPVERFVDTHSDFERSPMVEEDHIDWSRITDEIGDLRLNPADHDTDAFYAARLQRSPKSPAES